MTRPQRAAHAGNNGNDTGNSGPYLEDLLYVSAGQSPIGSPTWTRTKNLPVNSRLLCQLSYGGMVPG